MEEKQVIALTMQPDFLTKTLRSTGYDFETAVYELIDNSNKANATDIKVEFKADEKILLEKGKIIYKGSFKHLDNGCGMSFEEMCSFMQLSPRKVEYDNNNSSFFGAGGKTSMINISNIDGTSIGRIKSTKNHEVTIIEWIMANDERITKPYIKEHYFDENATDGTEITITNVELDSSKIKPVISNCGATYYPMLTNDSEINISLHFDIFGDDNGLFTVNHVLPEDPLYRDNEEVAKTCKEFIVPINYNGKTYDIKIDTVYLFEDQFKSKQDYHKWDKNKRDSGITAKTRCGLYANYGGRLIERGNNLPTIGLPDQFDMTGFRCMMTIDKELTELFKVKFNKTQGIVSFKDHPILYSLVTYFSKYRDYYKKVYGGSSRRNISKKKKIESVSINDRNYSFKIEKFTNSIVPCEVNYDKKQTIISVNGLTNFGKLLSSNTTSPYLKSTLEVFYAASASAASEFFQGNEDKFIRYMTNFTNTLTKVIKNGHSN